MGTLYVVRHSITALNKDVVKGDSAERIRGWLDVPLSKDGWKIARKTGKALENKNIIKIYSSDLLRTKETAAIISSDIGAPVVTTPMLRPWDVGKLEGMEYKKGIAVMKHFVKQRPEDPIPGGESYSSFYNRWKEAFVALLSAAEKLPPDMALCAVTHSRNIYCVEHILTKGEKPILFDGFINPGGVLKIDIDKNEMSIIFNGK